MIATETASKFKLPIVQTTATANPESDMEAELAAFEVAERARLGIKDDKQWNDVMLSPLLSKKDRTATTIIVGGLTMAHDFLLEGALTGLGYSVMKAAVPDVEAFNYGKEFGNRGQCNPTYFTVGNLVKFLCKLRDQGMTTEEINKKYVFVTAGACGPCRFGMYVTEYRKALRDAGFDGFRVFLFQQQGGLKQATGDDIGIEMNPPFFIAILKALLIGDVLNAVVYRIRPYEVTPGETDRVMQQAKEYLHSVFTKNANFFAAFPALLHVRKMFAAIKVDKLRPKAKASIIGEFWAMTTEGDGNYQLQRFLEKEGAENDIQILLNTLLYNLWEASRDTKERMFLNNLDGGHYGLKGMDGAADVAKKLAILRVADFAIRSVFQVFANLTGLHDYKLPNMEKIAEVSHKYYSNDLRGGEGHLEVGKLILNSSLKKSHMTISVKPFGCMPSSSVSDGVANMVADRYPESIFCAVETSGDGAVNFYSRVQMYLFKAKAKAEAEFTAALATHNVTKDEVAAFLQKHPSYAHPFHRSPHVDAGSAADVVHEVAPMIGKSVFGRAKILAARKVVSLRAQAKSVREAANVLRAQGPETWIRVKADAGFVVELLAGKLEGVGPVLAELGNRAMGAKVDPAVAPAAKYYAAAE